MNKYDELAKRRRLSRKMQRACKSKRRYETAEAAYQKGQQVYQCRYCYGFHRSGKFGRWLKELERINA
jgi:hypothetical protein